MIEIIVLLVLSLIIGIYWIWDIHQYDIKNGFYGKKKPKSLLEELFGKIRK